MRRDVDGHLLVTCNLSSATSGTTATIRITVKPNSRGTITNTVSVTSTGPTDPSTANNTATATTTVVR